MVRNPLYTHLNFCILSMSTSIHACAAATQHAAVATRRKDDGMMDAHFLVVYPLPVESTICYYVYSRV